MDRKRNNFALLIIFIAIFALIFSPSVKAIEVVISDNGSGSNEVVVNQSTQIEVTQTNEAIIVNDVESSADTGNNDFVANEGTDTSIATGNVVSETEIANSLNSSQVEVGCCEANSIEAKVSGNGSFSSNEINVNSNNLINVNTSNVTNIKNIVEGSANTGRNKANYNTGADVVIKTGNIKVKSDTENGINFSSVKVLASNPSANISIFDNGSSSESKVVLNINSANNVYQNFSSDIGNYIVWDLSTGKNEAILNSGGDVEINTGDIDLGIFINNLANIGGVEIDCCEDIIDPNDSDDGDEDDNDDNHSDDGGNDDEDDNDSSVQGSILPSAAATEAGGPGVIGLSDTSSQSARTLFFWISFIFVTMGGKIIVEEILPKTSSKRFSKR